jgi:hypothetical protein
VADRLPGDELVVGAESDRDGTLVDLLNRDRER